MVRRVSLVLLGAFLLLLPGGAMFVQEPNEHLCRAAHYHAVQKTRLPRPMARQSVLILAKRFPDRSRRDTAPSTSSPGAFRTPAPRPLPASPGARRAHPPVHVLLSPPLRC